HISRGSFPQSATALGELRRRGFYQRSCHECGFGWNCRRRTESSGRHCTLGSWCRCVSVGRWLGTETDKSGKVMVEPDLSVRDHPEVFVIGDTAHVVAPVRNLLGIKSRTPMLMPGVAQPAIQEGKYVARSEEHTSELQSRF